MHPKLEELLALRDGEGPVDVERHVASCPRCQDGLDELKSVNSALRSLPPAAFEHDLWPEIRRRVVAERRRSLARRIAAVAASVIAVIAAIALVRSPIPTSTTVSRDADRQLAIEGLAAASNDLEQVLRDPALRRQVMSARRAAVIVDLEDRIAHLDMTLDRGAVGDDGERAVALWSHRVELLDALVAARAGNGADEGVGYAVFHYEGSQP